MNIFFEEFNTPFNTIPFDKIKDDDFLPGLDMALERAKSKIEDLKNNPGESTFENVCETFESCNEHIDIVANTFFNLYSAETNEKLQKIAKEFSPKLTAYNNDLALDNDLFKRVKDVWDNKDKFGLNKEQEMLLTKQYKTFLRNGALLNEKDKEELRKIDNEMSKLTLEFGDHVLADTNNFEFVVKDKSELEGLPEGAIEGAAEMAKERGHEGNWVFTLDYPSYLPVVSYASNRKLREEIVKARVFVGIQDNENNNCEIIKKIVTLRQRRAELLGYDNHAEFVLEERMASTPDEVNSFLKDLLVKAKPIAEKEMDDLLKCAKKLDGIEKLERWDVLYYAEKLKKEVLNVDEEELKPYFKLENVIDGVFEVAKKLYGLEYRLNKDIPVYHEEVQAYEVYDDHENFIGIFYADYFPRKGKRNGAWMTEFKPQRGTGHVNQRPHVAIVCNFTRPTETKPSLLSLTEVLTLFHEFGHSLHGILANSTYASLSGTNVYWDFVELPSQILENWVYEKECLDLFAKHYETGESIPSDLVEKVVSIRTFHEARATVRQICLGMLDMSWHGKDPRGVENVEKYEKESTSSADVSPDIEGGVISTSFSHIFNGGYSAGYYSYKWAEVLDADAFLKFKEDGIFNKDTARSFQQNILSRGGTEHPMELFKRFRGRAPEVDALLKRGWYKLLK